MSLDHVWVGVVYRGLAKEIVQQLKFGPDRTVAEVIGLWLHESMSYIDTDLVTFVPTSRSRVRQRGFDHAEKLAESFAKHRHLILQSTLMRIGNNKQVGAARTDRLIQTKGSYKSKNQAVFRQKRLLIIDDITTTGATLSETARELKRNGAKSIDALVFAQTI